MSGMIIAAKAFARARWLQVRLRTRLQVLRHQQCQIDRLMISTLPQLPFYATTSYSGFADLPIIDKQTLLANFSQLNRLKLNAEDIRTALESGQQRIGSHVIGHSTGTSGNRGYYVISDAERFVWLGTILAKTLPDALWRWHRVALALPGISDLYQSASTGSRIALGVFDLAKGIDHWRSDLAAFAPDTIVAPPKVLRHLAESGQLSAQHIFSGAEVLDPIDREVIEAATGRRVREIYMATEGLFGVGCAHGTLHLAEDVVKFEWQQPDPQSDLVSPIVTDFTRKEQAMVRYRMNDLMQLSDTPCPCGSPFQAVARIEGRQDDIFLLAAADGNLRMVTPDVLRNAVVDADPAIRDFRIVQTGASAILVTLDADLPREMNTAVQNSIANRLQPLACLPVDIDVARGLTLPFDHKLRRVRRDWHPDQAYK
jgi:putative adenylate-forming enzyme